MMRATSSPSLEGGIKASIRGAIHGTFDISTFYNSFIAGLAGLTGAGNEFSVLGEPRM